MKLGVRVPCPYFVDTDAGVLIMEMILGLKLKQFIWQGAARDGILTAWQWSKQQHRARISPCCCGRGFGNDTH
jgi:hypothetical protein